eukprot:1160068-Pelagomonas_calceolata.AAC.1
MCAGGNRSSSNCIAYLWTKNLRPDAPADVSWYGHPYILGIKSILTPKCAGGSFAHDARADVRACARARGCGGGIVISSASELGNKPGSTLVSSDRLSLPYPCSYLTGFPPFLSVSHCNLAKPDRTPDGSNPSCPLSYPFLILVAISQASPFSFL